MPQFDSITFCTQVFWFTLVFTIFYIVVIRNFLPALTRIMKIRKKKLDADQNSSSSISDEENKALVDYENLYVNSVQTSKDLLSKTDNSGHLWISNTLQDTNINKLPTLNQLYLKNSINFKSKMFIINRTIIHSN